MKNAIVYTDGAARGNPGESASGFAVYVDDRLVKEDISYNGRETNNYAEYRAIINALDWCRLHLDADSFEIRVFSDSELVVKQANRAYKTKSEKLKKLNAELLQVAGKFKSVSFGHVERSNRGISYVDRKLNIFLDKRQ